MHYTGLQCCEPRCKSLLGSHAVREGKDFGILRDIECADSLNSRSRYHRCHSKEITVTQDITGLGCCEGKGCLKMAESLGSAFLCNIHHVFRCIQNSTYSHHSHSTLSMPKVTHDCLAEPQGVCHFCFWEPFQAVPNPQQPIRGADGSSVPGCHWCHWWRVQKWRTFAKTSGYTPNPWECWEVYKDYKGERGFHLTKFPVVAGGYCWFMLISYPKV